MLIATPLSNQTVCVLSCAESRSLHEAIKLCVWSSWVMVPWKLNERKQMQRNRDKFGSLRYAKLADTNGKISHDSLHFHGMLAKWESTWTNSHGHGHGHGIFILATHPEGIWSTNPKPSFARLSQHHPRTPDPSSDYLVAQVGSSFSRVRVQVGANIAEAVAARFVHDNSPGWWPSSPCFFQVQTSQQALDLALPTISLCTNRVLCVACVQSVCACCITIPFLFVLFVHVCFLSICFLTMCLPCIICPHNCTASFLHVYSPFRYSLFPGHRPQYLWW